jgi:hypothetical protein
MQKKFFRVKHPYRKIHVAKKNNGSDRRYRSLCGRSFNEDGTLQVAETDAFRGDECRRCQHCRTKRYGYQWEGKWSSGSVFWIDERLPMRS